MKNIMLHTEQENEDILSIIKNAKGPYRIGDLEVTINNIKLQDNGMDILIDTVEDLEDGYFVLNREPLYNGYVENGKVSMMSATLMRLYRIGKLWKIGDN